MYSFQTTRLRERWIEHWFKLLHLFSKKSKSFDSCKNIKYRNIDCWCFSWYCYRMLEFLAHNYTSHPSLLNQIYLPIKSTALFLLLWLWHVWWCLVWRLCLRSFHLMVNAHLSIPPSPLLFFCTITLERAKRSEPPVSFTRNSFLYFFISFILLSLEMKRERERESRGIWWMEERVN